MAAAAHAAEKPANLTLRDMHGTKVRLSDLRGKTVVFNFWATWCGPCNAEMPMLVKAAAAYAGKNVVFVGASVDSTQTQAKVAEYLQKLGIAYAIWVGATDDDMKRMSWGTQSWEPHSWMPMAWYGHAFSGRCGPVKSKSEWIGY